jgi:anti-anti-sigma factor
MAESYEHISVDRRDGIAILKVTTKRISEYEAAGELRKELIDAFDKEGVSQAIVDMADLETMSSVGYGPFVSLRLHVTNAGGRVVLCNLSEFINQVFTTARLLINPGSTGSRFESADTLEDAIRMLTSGD